MTPIPLTGQQVFCDARRPAGTAPSQALALLPLYNLLSLLLLVLGSLLLVPHVLLCPVPPLSLSLSGKLYVSRGY